MEVRIEFWWSPCVGVNYLFVENNKVARSMEGHRICKERTGYSLFRSSCNKATSLTVDLYLIFFFFFVFFFLAVTTFTKDVDPNFIRFHFPPASSPSRRSKRFCIFDSTRSEWLMSSVYIFFSSFRALFWLRSVFFKEVRLHPTTSFLWFENFRKKIIS